MLDFLGSVHSLLARELTRQLGALCGVSFEARSLPLLGRAGFADALGAASASGAASDAGAGAGDRVLVFYATETDFSEVERPTRDDLQAVLDFAAVGGYREAVISVDHPFGDALARGLDGLPERSIPVTRVTMGYGRQADWYGGVSFASESSVSIVSQGAEDGSFRASGQGIGKIFAGAMQLAVIAALASGVDKGSIEQHLREFKAPAWWFGEYAGARVVAVTGKTQFSQILDEACEAYDDLSIAAPVSFGSDDHEIGAMLAGVTRNLVIYGGDSDAASALTAGIEASGLTITPKITETIDRAAQEIGADGGLILVNAAGADTIDELQRSVQTLALPEKTRGGE